LDLSGLALICGVIIMLPAAALRAILIYEDSEQQEAECFGLLCSFYYFCGESISMRRLHPERIFFAVVAPLVFGGLILSVIGILSKNHGLMRVGVIAFATGAILSSLPLVLTLIYFGWQRLLRLWKRE
jgi:hypothetical protein